MTSFCFASDVDVQLSEGDNSNFTQLQNDIDKSNDVCDLQMDYVCEDNFKADGVNISKNIEIDGHDFSINALNKSAIFNVSSKEVNFKNIKFIDSQNAIVANGSSKIIFENCKFINAGITINGTNLTFKNCEFTHNSFIDAQAENIEISDSQIYDLHISDVGLLLNATNILFNNVLFENNIAYNLSGDTLYTGGFASLINVSASSVGFSKSTFRNNTLGFLIYSLNTTDVFIDNVTFEDTDFRAYKSVNSIKKDIPGNGTVFAGNLTNLHIIDTKFRNIEGSRSSSLININLTGNLSIKKSEFSDLSCPYGFIEIYDNCSNPNRGYVTFDECSFKNIDTDYNMSCYDWDADKGEYIWSYGHGGGKGIRITHSPTYSYIRFYWAYGSDGYINKDLSFTNIEFDNVEGGGYYFDFAALNLNIENFTAVNSKIGQTDADFGYYSWGLLFNGYCGGNATLKNILQDNISVLDYNHTGYNSTFAKYLCDKYSSNIGGAGCRIGAFENIEVFNINITNSIGSDEGLLVLNAGENITFDKVLIENVTGGEVVELGKYYPDLDLQTYDYYGNYTAGLCTVDSSNANVVFSNLIVRNSSVSGPQEYWSRQSEALLIEGANVTVENITLVDYIDFVESHTYSGGMISISAYNAVVKHILADNVKSCSIVNESHYDETLGEYVWEYAYEGWSPAITIDGSLFADVRDITMTNCEKGMDDLFYVLGGAINVDSLIIENISSAIQLKIDYDSDLNQYIYRAENSSGSYEGVLTAYPNKYLNISNMVISNVVATDLGNVAYIAHGGSNTDAYMNFVNITVSDVIPLDNNRTYYDKNLGRYISVKDMYGYEPAFDIGVRGSITFDNFNVENINGLGTIFNLDANSVVINNSTFKNMSSYKYGTTFDEKTNQTVLGEYDNKGGLMHIQSDEIVISNSDFRDLNFSNEDQWDSAIISCEGRNTPYLVDIINSNFTNCTVNKAYEANFDPQTGKYDIMWSNNQYGAVLMAKDYWNICLEDMDFINCSGIKGGAFSYIKQYSTNFIVKNCKFISNKAEYGGAAYFESEGGSFENCTFLNNTAENGGALYIEGFALNVYSCRFLNNTAGFGGAIYYNNGYNSISECEFRYNKADSGSALYVTNELYVDSCVILENQAKSASLTSSYVLTGNDIEVKAVFEGNDNLMNGIYTTSSCYLGNVTYWSSSGEVNSDDANPYETKLEDGINITLELYNPSFRITRTVNITNISGEVKLGLSNIKNDRYFLIVKHEEDNYYSEIMNVDMIQIGLLDSPIDLEVDDIFYGENATVNVRILADATGSVVFEIDGVNFTTENLTDAFASANKSCLAGGIHNVTVYYSGDATYIENHTTKSFTVKPIPAVMLVTTDGGDYRTDIPVNITFNANVSGKVILVVDNEFGNTLTITNASQIQTVVNSLDAGSYNITAYFMGDNNYLSCSNWTVLIVNPIALEVNVTANNATTAENITFTIILPDDFVGKVNITVDGISQVYDIAGTTQLTFPKLAEGNKAGSLKFYANGNYNDLKVYPVNFTVTESTCPTMNITIEDVTYSENATAYISVSSQINGSVRILIDNLTFTATLTNGTGTANLYGLSAGGKTALASLITDEWNITSSTKFNVMKAQSEISIEANGDDIIVNVTVKASGNVTLYINGRVYTLNLTGNVLELKDCLTIRNNSVIAIYNGDANYLPSKTSDNFIINKIESTVNATAEDITYGSDAIIVVSVGANQTGYVTVSIDNRNYTSPIKEGAVSFNVHGLNATTYIVKVEYSGDENFTLQDNFTSLTVNKANLTVSVIGENITVNNNASFIVENVPSDFRGLLNITVDSLSYCGEAKSVIKMPKLSEGSKIAEIVFYGDDNYNDSRLTVEFNVLKIAPTPTTLTIEVEDVDYLNNATATVTVSDNANGTVIVSVGEKVFEPVEVINGTARINLGVLSAGIKNITANFTSDDVNITSSSKFTVRQASSSVEITVNDTSVTVKVNPGETGILLVYINGKENDFIYKGEITIENALIIGDNSIIAIYEGSENYTASKATKDIAVIKFESSVNVTAQNITYGSEATIIVNVPTNQTGYVTIVVDGKNYTKLISDGQAIFRIAGLKVNEYKVDVTYLGDVNYTSQVNETLFCVAKADLVAGIVGENITDNQNARFILTVPDDFTGKVRIKVDGITYVGNVESLIVLDKLKQGDKVASATFFDDSNYNNLTLTVPFRVSHELIDILSINSENMTRGYNSEFDYQAAFLDGEGNALKNTIVRFIVNSREFNATTNDDGIAKLTTSKLNPGTYNITSVNTVTGENATNEVKIVKRITENRDLTMDYRDGSLFKVKVWGEDGNLAPAGEIIDIYVNAIHYVAKVNKNGYASVKINLLPKTYKVVAEYRGFKTTNKLVVKQTLKALKKVTTIKKGGKLVLKASLKWSNGKGIKGKKITFNIKGKKFSAKTNAKGIAKVTIKKNFTKKLKKGKKYTVKVTYAVKEKYGNDHVKVSDTVKCYVKVKK